MVFTLLILTLILLFLFQLPLILISYTINNYNNYNDEIKGTGLEFIKHLLKKADIINVKVLVASLSGYNARTKTIYLNGNLINNRSISSVTMAAHEFSHLLQDIESHPGFKFRNRLVIVSNYFNILALLLTVTFSLLGLFADNRPLVLLAIVTYLMPGIFRLFVTIINLPLEFDASFNRAMPLLTKGEYLSGENLIIAKKILTAATYTYVAAALAQIFNLIYFKSNKLM